MRRFVFALSMFAPAAGALADTWQAEYLTTPNAGMIWFDDAHLRIDFDDVRQTTLLFDRKEKLAYEISRKEKVYFLSEPQVVDPVLALCSGESPAACFPQRQTLKKVGSDTLEGRTCDRYDVSGLVHEGKKAKGRFWHCAEFPSLHFVKLVVTPSAKKPVRTVELRGIKKVPDDARRFTFHKEFAPISP